MSPIIWHNPKCRKSREALALLQGKGLTPTVRLYLEDPPSPSELRTVLSRLSMAPRALMRRQEAEYKALNLADAGLDDAALIEAMAANPRLIERPVVLLGDRAVLTRPAENLEALLG